MLLSRQLLLESDPLEFLTEMLDPIFGLLALCRRHESCNSVRAARRAQHAVFRMVVNGGPDFELVRHCKGLSHTVAVPRALKVHTFHYERCRAEDGRCDQSACK